MAKQRKTQLRAVIGIGNYKGGVGKTTTTLNLAMALHLQGYRVMVIDMDRQANLSSCTDWDPDLELQHYPTIYNVLCEEAPIPVYRSKQMRSTDVIAEQARQAEKFRLCITPEGTRKAQPEWKKGFYYIALKAEIPILLYGLDFADREIVCTKTIIPNGDVEAQMKEIKEYYKGFKGLHPHQFIV